MSYILLGLESSYKLTSELVEEIKELGHEPLLVNTGYDVIREAVRLGPSAIVLHTALDDCDVLKTSIWLSRSDRTSGIPQFLISTNGVKKSHWKWELGGAAETVCNFKGQCGTEEGVEGIVNLLREYGENVGFPPGLNGQPPAEPPSKETIQADLVEAFESHFVKSRLLLRLLQINRNINEVDYFAKVLMEQVAALFDCILVSFLWKGDHITEYDLITAPLDMGKFEALRHMNHASVRKAGWGPDGPTDIITWGREFLTDNEMEIDPEEFAAECVQVDINFKGMHRGNLTLAAAQDTREHLDTDLIDDFKRHLAPIFSNFIMYQDLELNLNRDDRIFQSIGELAGVSTLELENFHSFILQSLLILLDLYSTNRGAIISVDPEGVKNDFAALGEPEEFFYQLTSDGKPIIDKVLKEPGFYMFSREPMTDDDVERLDTDKLENLVIAPLECADEFFGAILLANIRPFNTGKEKKSIDTFAKLISNHIYNKNLSDEFIEKKSIEEQLNLAREIQMGLLPDGEIANRAFDIFARSLPAKQVGGDFFDYYPIDDEWLGLSIADISGKGIPASLLMSMTKSVFQSLFEAESHPPVILAKANTILSKQFFSDKFVTAIFGMLVPRRLVFSSGGHHPVIVYRKAADRFEKIDPEGIALGIIEDAEFEVAEVEFDPGDVAIFFTDGLCEANNSDGEQFGYGRIEEVVRKKADYGAKEVVEGLFTALEEHTAGMPAFDDTTIIIVIAKEDPKEG